MEINYVQKERITAKLINWLIILISLWAFTPVIRVEVNQLYGISCMITTLFLIILSNKGKIKTEIAVVLFWIGLQVLYKLLGVSDDTWANHSNPFSFFFAMIACYYLLDNLKKTTLIKTGWILYGIVTLNLFYHYYIFFLNEKVSLYDVNILLEKGIVVGGTSFVTTIAVYGMLNFIFFYLTNTRWKWFYFVNIVLTLYFLFNIQTRAIALIILILFMVAVISLKAGNNVQTTRLLAFSVFSLVVVFILPELLRLLISLDIPYYSRKLTAILNVVIGNVAINANSLDESSFTARLFVENVSLNTWLASPVNFLFGKGFDAGFWFESGIGHHSEVIDILPRYGLLGFLITAYIFKQYYIIISRHIKYSGFLFIFWGFIFYAVLNGVYLPENGAAFCWLVPFTMLSIKEEGNNTL